MNRYMNYFAAFIISLLLINAVYAQHSAFSDTARKLDELFSKWNTATPGAAISISRNGKTLYQKSFGMADLEHNVINTAKTVFEAGSVSKQFTAAAVLLLVLEGKIGLQDDIRKHFPDFPDYGSVITVEHLLHHTSGLRDWGSVISLSGWPRGTRIYTPDHVKEIIWRQKALNFLPGTAYGYSNSNYNLLGFLVEKVSGKNLADFTNEKLFKPAGMNNTQWRNNFRTIVPDRAIAYSRSGNIYRQNMPFEHTFGHGALLTTVDDLEKWNRRWTLHTLGEELNRLQKIKVKLSNGKEITYAAGVVVTSFNGNEEISHSGATAGYRAWLAYYPARELSVAYLSNDGSVDPGSIGRSVAEIFFGKETREVIAKPEGSIAVSRQQLEKFAGLYKSIHDEDVDELVVSNDSLKLKNVPGSFLPLSPNKFYFERFIVTFPENMADPDRLLLQNPGGDTGTYVRVQPFNPTVKELQEFAGKYHSEEAGSELRIQLHNDKLWLVLFGNERISLTPSFTDAFFDENNALLQFTRDKRKRITGFTVSISRAKNVLFLKQAGN